MNRSVHAVKPAGPAGDYAIRSVERVVDILDLLAGTPAGASLSSIAKTVGLPRSSAFRYLATLEARSYVSKDAEHGLYQLGLGFPTLRTRVEERLTDAARPYLERLSARFGETANLGMLDGTRIAYLAIVESPRQVRLAARAGDRDPLHCTALGKAVASRLSPRELERVLQVEGLERRTEATITDRARFLAVLEQVRRDGYAVDDRENESDGRCVAVALPLPAIPAAVSMSAPVNRFPLSLADEVAAALQHSVTGIVEDLGHGSAALRPGGPRGAAELALEHPDG